MKLKTMLDNINGGFASANNNSFRNYSGNVAYYVKKQISGNDTNKVYYFTCKNATFQTKQNGYIIWKDGDWLDGQFFGSFDGGKFWNGKLNKR